MTQQLSSEKSIFLEALELPSQVERDCFIEKACATDRSLHARVEALLAAHLRPQPLLDLPAATSLAQAGKHIGPYKLLEQIGEGGMGLVFMAEQQRPVRRLVALKIVKPGMDSKQVIARFEAERQALAMMDHPHIAKVLDAGTTEIGRPYFVMELVRGIPINEFCDNKRFTVRQRLELFVQVCQAVQHAHQQGIIHRDLKPTNVLVTLHDVLAVPKVIDFGIAKALGPQLTEQTLHTGFSQLVGTPLYMSPEQAEMNQLGVDTRSDIYSLGVLLYELLTGTTPFDKEVLSKVGIDELRRMIREEEPPRPSARVSTLKAEALSTISQQRSMAPRRIPMTLRGELDWIVIKALEKDRSRRYESANNFAQDVNRYLANEPVQACPPSAWYRFRKFSLRNKPGLTIAGLILAFLMLLGGGAGWLVRDRVARQATAAARIEGALEEIARLRDRQNWPEARAAVQRAELLLAGSASHGHHRRRFEELLRDLNMVDQLERVREAQLYAQDDFWNHGSADSAYEVAFQRYGIDVLSLDSDAAAQRVRTSPIAEQLSSALDDWAWVSRGQQGRHDRIRALVCLVDPDPWRVLFRDRAVHKNRRALMELADRPEAGSQSPTIIAFLGRALNEAGAPDKAVEVLTAAQRRHPEHFWLNLHLGSILRWNVRPPRHQEAAGYLRAALAQRPQAVRVHLELGGSLLSPGNEDEAIAQFRSALVIQPDYAHPHHSIGNALAMQGNWSEAIESYQECLRRKSDPTLQARVYYDLGTALRAMHQLDEAIAAWQQTIAIDPKYFRAHDRLGRAFEQQGKLEESLAAFRQALALKPRNAEAHANFGWLLGRQGKLDEAIRWERKAVALDPQSAAAQNGLGWVLLHQRKFAEAETALRQAIALNPKYVNAHVNLGAVLKKQGKQSEVIPIWKKLVELDPDLVTPHTNLAWHLATAPDPQLREPQAAVFHAQKAVDLAPTPNHWSNLGVALWRAGDNQAAVQALETADRLCKDGDHHHRFFLAMAYWQTDERDKARQMYERGVAWMDKNQPNSEELKRFRVEAEELIGEELADGHQELERKQFPAGP